MAVTESSLLSNFLLPPAPLSVSLSLEQFTELFPKSKQSDSVIPQLYKELQRQRAQDVERVKVNIKEEVKRGESQQRQLARVRHARLRQEHGDDAAELSLEAKLFPENDGGKTRPAHTVESVIPEMEQASADIEEEITEMERDAEAILQDLRKTIGDLSDLRYGQLRKTPGGEDLNSEVIQGLKRLQQLCNDVDKR